MKRERIQFIVNPFSGTTKKTNLPQLLQKHIDHNRFDFDIVYTERAEHAIELAKKAADNQYDIVCAVGGDGSVNEVAKSLVNTQTALAILPAGSGNGFAGHLELSRNLLQAILKLNKSEAQWVDTCMANEHFFINVAGIGFDALVAYRTKKSKRRGFLAYLWTALKEAASFKSMNLTLEVDGKITKGKYIAAVVANAKYYGYGFSISPLSSVQDGVMDLVLIKDTWIINYFLQAYRFLTKTLHKSNLVEVISGKEVTITMEGQQHFHVDGEGYQLNGSLNCHIFPKSIKVMS